MKKLIYTVLIVAITLFGLTFSYKNHQLVEVNYYFGLHFDGSLPLLLLITFALGLLVGYLVALFGRINLSLNVSGKPHKTPAMLPTAASPSAHSPLITRPQSVPHIAG